MMMRIRCTNPVFFAFCCGFGDGLKHFLVVFHAILTQNLKYCFCAIYSVLIRLLAGHLLQLNKNLRQESTHTRCDFQAAPCLVAHLEQTDDNWKVNFSYCLWIWFHKLKFQWSEEPMICDFFISFALPIQDDELWGPQIEMKVIYNLDSCQDVKSWNIMNYINSLLRFEYFVILVIFRFGNIR